MHGSYNFESFDSLSNFSQFKAFHTNLSWSNWVIKKSERLLYLITPFPNLLLSSKFGIERYLNLINVAFLSAKIFLFLFFGFVSKSMKYEIKFYRQSHTNYLKIREIKWSERAEICLAYYLKIFEIFIEVQVGYWKTFKFDLACIFRKITCLSAKIWLFLAFGVVSKSTTTLQSFLITTHPTLLESFDNVSNFFVFFFYLGFLSRTFIIHRTAGEGGGYLYNSSLPLPPASQILRHYPRDYWRELTSAHS